MFFIALEDEESQLKIERLYYRYRDIMYKTAYGILKDESLAEDAISESFIRIIRNLHKINESDESSTKNFLIIVCRNVAINMHHSKTYLNDCDNFADHISDGITPEKIILSKESVSEIADIIYGLDTIYRDVILLRYEDSLTSAEIADLLGISQETAKKRLQRAKAKILNQLKKEGIIDG